MKKKIIPKCVNGMLILKLRATSVVLNHDIKVEQREYIPADNTENFLVELVE